MSDRHPFVDAQGLAGAWTLAAAGPDGRFDLKHRVSLPGGFGNEVLDVNRSFFAEGWQQEDGVAYECEPQDGIAFLAGTPPCSGFSLLNTSKQGKSRGPESSINDCMRELITYAGRCTGTDGRPGPEVVAFESVQGAYTQGRSLMQALRNMLETRTGERYDLNHVLMSGSSVGSAQMRHRYFFVVSRVPFGADAPKPQKIVTYADAIGDLEGLKQQWEDQPITGAPSAWAAPLRRQEGLVDDHISLEPQRLLSLFEDLLPFWNPGEAIHKPARRFRETNGTLPTILKDRWDAEYDRPKGWSWPTRIHPDRPGFVVTGSGVWQFIHYSEPRLLTVRELARLMGYPDNWEWPAKAPMQASMWIGKCAPVQSCRWLSNWVAESLDGRPGEHGHPLEDGEREYVLNYTLDYRRWPREISGWNTNKVIKLP